MLNHHLRLLSLKLTMLPCRSYIYANTVTEHFKEIDFFLLITELFVKIRIKLSCFDVLVIMIYPIKKGEKKVKEKELH